MKLLLNFRFALFSELEDLFDLHFIEQRGKDKDLCRILNMLLNGAISFFNSNHE